MINPNGTLRYHCKSSQRHHVTNFESPIKGLAKKIDLVDCHYTDKVKQIFVGAINNSREPRNFISPVLITK